LILLISILFGLIAFYLLLTLLLSFVVQRIPRNPIKDEPDWGRVIDTRIPTADGGSLEVWRVEPERGSRGIIVFAHGWGRNRDRMVYRARLFADLGFTAVMHSARDHGGSSKSRLVNAVKFAEDIEAVLQWINEPVSLYGHSAGAAGAIIAAHRNPEKIKRLFLEASYAYTKEGLLSLYKWANRFFGTVFGPMIIFWWDLFYPGAMDQYSPANLAPDLGMPVMIIHGEKDQRFPVAFAHTLKQQFPANSVDMYIAPGVDHSDASLTPGYPESIRSFLNRYGEK
jgi:pimeloyl-ACP methyl ester carboxylesterase